MADKSVSDLLRERGLGHRKPEGWGYYGKREVFRLADGHSEGVFDVFEAIARFLPEDVAVTT